MTRKFFITPVFSEFYQDIFQNIDKQYTAGTGIGYSIVDTQKLEWDVSGGPAILYTEYVNVRDDDNNNPISPAFELYTKLDVELNRMTDFIYSYKLTYTDEASGVYKHHMVAAFENEITGWLDFDITGVWDYILKPEEREDVAPSNTKNNICLSF